MALFSRIFLKTTHIEQVKVRARAPRAGELGRCAFASHEEEVIHYDLHGEYEEATIDGYPPSGISKTGIQIDFWVSARLLYLNETTHK